MAPISLAIAAGLWPLRHRMVFSLRVVALVLTIIAWLAVWALGALVAFSDPATPEITQRTTLVVAVCVPLSVCSFRFRSGVRLNPAAPWPRIELEDETSRNPPRRRCTRLLPFLHGIDDQVSVAAAPMCIPPPCQIPPTAELGAVTTCSMSPGGPMPAWATGRRAWIGRTRRPNTDPSGICQVKGFG